MRVLYFHQHFSTPAGATGTRSYEMARKLIERGHTVTMVCGSYGIGRSGLSDPFEGGVRSGVVDGIDVIELELPYANTDSFLKRTGTFLKFAWRSVSIALTLQYDCVFATTTPLTTGIPGIFAKVFRRKPFVFEVRDLWPELPKAEWCSYHAADKCIGLAPGIVEGIIKRGITNEKVAMIPNGCDLELFSTASKGAGWRPEGVKERDLVAVFTGAHGIANGLDAVLNAAGVLLRKNRHDIKLVFIGEGKEKKRLIERAKREHLENCLFLAAVPKTKLVGLLREADVGLMILANVPAFYFGTSPNKFFDYIATGKPVLNNYPGWLAGMIAENQCGFSVAPEDPNAFAEALMSAADNRQQLKEMGKRARALAEREFDRLVLAERFVDVLESVGSGKRF